jgi:hypothetical protein
LDLPPKKDVSRTSKIMAERDNRVNREHRLLEKVWEDWNLPTLPAGHAERGKRASASSEQTY